MKQQCNRCTDKHGFCSDPGLIDQPGYDGRNRQEI
ncbi:Uncharacterised protein [Vibrio cholerae]|nr:Uncharacterised protein [Vibrio cholerae]